MTKMESAMLFYQAKQFHMCDMNRNRLDRVVVGGELFTESELLFFNFPRHWFRKVLVNPQDAYLLYSSRFVNDRDRIIIEEVLT